MQVAPEESRAPKAQGLRRPSAVAGVLVLLRQNRLPLSLLSPHGLLYEVLVCGGRVAEARGEGPPPADRHRLEEALGGSPVEARDVDADAKLVAWVLSRWVRFLGSLVDRVPRPQRYEAHAGLMTTHGGARPRVVPGHLPHDQVRGPPEGSPRARPERGAGRASLCEGGRRLVSRRGA